MKPEQLEKGELYFFDKDLLIFLGKDINPYVYDFPSYAYDFPYVFLKINDGCRYLGWTEVFLYAKKATDSRILKYLNRNLKEAIENREYEGLDYKLHFQSDAIEVGCQRIPKESLLEIANDILSFYGDKK